MKVVRHALRRYRRQPLPTAAVVLTLALGIGTTTAIFSIVHGIVLRPLPYPEAGRLVRVHQVYETLRSSTNPRLQRIWNRLPLSYLNARDYRQASPTLAALGLFSEYSATVAAGEEPLRIEAAGIDAGLLATLGVAPNVGRGFTEGEVERQERRVLLGHELWKRLFDGDPESVGRTLTVDGEPHAVVGVMPAGFRVARDDRLWTPLRLGDRDREARDNQRLRAVARLAAGASLDQARAELDRLARAHGDAYPDTNAGVGVDLVPLRESIVGDSRPLLALLLAAAAAVLLVACANVAHLLLAQTSTRRRELAVRLALGADRRTLAAQLLAESLILALGGGAAGLLLAVLSQRLLRSWIPGDLPRTDAVAIDGTVVAFTLAVSLSAALLCGLLPALSASAAAAARNFRGAAGDDPGGTGPGLLSTHDGLVVAELALTLTLAATAGLLVGSFLRLSAVDPGFEAEGVVVQQVELPAWRYPETRRQEDFAGRLLDRLSALPGVRSAGLTTKLPFAGLALVAGFRLPGDPADQDWVLGRSASLKFVTRGYFETLGITVLEGRGFDASEGAAGGRVVVVNETLAGKTWPGESPIGRTLLMGADGERFTVVGVVSDVRHDGLENDPGVLMYQPWGRLAGAPGPRRLIAVARVDGDPASLLGPVREIVRNLDPALPLPATTTLAALLAESLGAPRSRTALMSALAALALLLALVGTYAVTSFSAARRRREIGIRMALGADRRRIRSLMLRRAGGLTAAGLALGVPGALYGGHLLEGLLYGVDASDPWTLAAAAVLLAAAALVAGWLPARRASRIDPVVALREE